MNYQQLIEQSKARRMSQCVHLKNESCEVLYRRASTITERAIIRCPFGIYPKYTDKEKIEMINIKVEILRISNRYTDIVSNIAAEKWPSTNLNNNKY